MSVLWSILILFIVENILLSIKYKDKLKIALGEMCSLKRGMEKIQAVHTDDEEGAWYNQNAPILILHGGVEWAQI